MKKTKTLWDVLRESKDGLPYINSDEQYERLRDILRQMSEEDVKRIATEWAEKSNELIDNEFDKLHIGNGGIVDGGDDTFYSDFGSWVVAQGKPLFNRYKKHGHQTIIRYIEKHKIDKDDYTFENMTYVFDEIESLKK